MKRRFRALVDSCGPVEIDDDMDDDMDNNMDNNKSSISILEINTHQSDIKADDENDFMKRKRFREDEIFFEPDNEEGNNSSKKHKSSSSYISSFLGFFYSVGDKQ